MLIALLRLVSLVALFAISLAGTALAQASKVESSARIDAVSYQPIPPGAALETQPESQSQMDEDAWHQVDADLSGRGYAIGPDGNLVVTVATQLVSRLNADQSVGDVNARKSDPKNSALFSTGGGTLLNPDAPINTTDRVFRVNLTVYDKSSGHYLWRGTVERADAAIDPATALREMLPALLDHFGETVEGVDVPLVQ
ncbi:hypothetical protein [Dongia sp.]|uniref:hypothetical protein n=1 Tax=Dongia sp. TaxID=1977262 RepID=UPI0035B02D68